MYQYNKIEPLGGRFISSYDMEGKTFSWSFFFYSLPFWFPFLYYTPLRIGVWIESEFLVLTLFLFSFFAAVYLAFTSSVAFSFAKSPPMFFLGGLILLSCLFLPFHAFKGASWFGPPETGLGVGMYICFYTLIFGYAHVLQRCSKPLLMGATIAALCIGGWVYFVDAGLIKAENIHSFRSFLAFIGIGLFAFLTHFNALSHKAFCAIAGVVLIVVSDNKTAIAGVVVLPLLLMGFLSFSYKTRRVLGTVLVLLMPVIVCAAEWFFVQPDKFLSLWSRLLSQKIVFTALFDNPMIFLHGLGWGHFTEILLKYKTVVTQDAYAVHSFMGHAWDALDRYDFHNHNAFLETLSAQGIPGLVMHMGFLASAMYFCPPKHQLAAFSFLFLYVLTSTNWFEMPSSYVFTALGFACILPPQKTQRRRRRSLREKRFFFSVIAGTLLMTFLMGFKVSLENDEAGSGALEGYIRTHFPQYLATSFYADYQMGGKYLAHNIDHFVGFIKSGDGTIDIEDFSMNYARFMDSAVRYKPFSYRLYDAKKRLEDFLYQDLKEIKELDPLRAQYAPVRRTF